MPISSNSLFILATTWERYKKRCIKCENFEVLGRGTPPDRNIYLATTPTCTCVTKIRKLSMTNTEQWDEMTREDDMDPLVVEYADDTS